MGYCYLCDNEVPDTKEEILYNCGICKGFGVGIYSFVFPLSSEHDKQMKQIITVIYIPYFFMYLFQYY